MNQHTFLAGAAQVDITPQGSVPLYGYPMVPRNSSGVNDPLLASALYLHDGKQSLLMIGTDLIYMTRQMAVPIRKQLAQRLDMPVDAILITASHTHSGPPTRLVSWMNSGKSSMCHVADADYCKMVIERSVQAGCMAAKNAVPAQVALTQADGSELGTNRRHPKGPSIPQMPVLAARDLAGELIGVMVVCSMHPTVLHEDSTLISGDFPGLARQYLQANLLKDGKPLVYHMGASGNQSPRHVVKANTMQECHRLGNLLGKEIQKAVTHVEWQDHLPLSCKCAEFTLPVRQIIDMDTAKGKLIEVENRLKTLRDSNAPVTTIRTAECDWFGAIERVQMVRAKMDGLIDKLAEENMPGIVQILGVGEMQLVCWPGEVFVEFAIQVMEQFPQVHVITCANGELQGYLVTEQAITEDAYEANNAIFASPQGGQVIVQTTLELLKVDDA